MKNILILLIVLSCSSLVFSQGTLKITGGTTVRSMNGSYIVASNIGLENKGIIQQSKNGTTKFTGGVTDSISGTGFTRFGRFQMNMVTATNLLLKTNILVDSEFVFTGGLFDLGNSIVDLGSSGSLINESESSRTYTNGTGYVQITKNLSTPSAANPGNLGAIISSSSNLGNTIIRRGHKVQQNVFGSNNSIKRYFDILPANNTNLNATLQLDYFNAEVNSLDENTLNLWRSSNSINWTSVCNFIRNGSANYVQSSGINSFSRWTLSTVTPPLVVAIPDVYAVNPGGVANTIYIGYGPSSVTLNAQVSGGAPPYTYKWTIGSSAGPAVNTNASFTVSPTATTTYYLNVKDAFGCNITAVTKQIQVIDVRCGSKLDKVIVCKFQNGNFTTTCVTKGSVAGLLSSGSYLGTCTTPLTKAGSNAEKEITNETRFGVTAFPNPSASYFRLSTETDNTNEKIGVSVFDLQGRIIEQRHKLYAKELLQIGSNYLPGVYLIKITQGNRSKTLKLVKM